MIKRELVEEERWIEPTRFSRLLAIYQVLPGPEAHELCVHLGMMKGKRLGGVLAGLGLPFSSTIGWNELSKTNDCIVSLKGWRRAS